MWFWRRGVDCGDFVWRPVPKAPGGKRWSRDRGGHAVGPAAKRTQRPTDQDPSPRLALLEARLKRWQGNDFGDLSRQMPAATILATATDCGPDHGRHVRSAKAHDDDPAPERVVRPQRPTTWSRLRSSVTMTQAEAGIGRRPTRARVARHGQGASSARPSTRRNSAIEGNDQHRHAAAAVCLALAVIAGAFALISTAVLNWRPTGAPLASRIDPAPTSQTDVVDKAPRSPVTTVITTVPTEPFAAPEMTTSSGRRSRIEERPTKLKINTPGDRRDRAMVYRILPAQDQPGRTSPKVADNANPRASSPPVVAVQRYAPMTLGELIELGGR